MSSLAQEESRSISENTTWGRRKAFADGNYSLPWKSFYGYDKGEDGKPVINEKQAEVIRLIYKMFLEGYSAQAIANALYDKGIKSPMGKDRWNTYNIMYILQNLMLAIWIQTGGSRYVNNAWKSSVSAAFDNGRVQDRNI